MSPAGQVQVPQYKTDVTCLSQCWSQEVSDVYMPTRKVHRNVL